MSEDAKAAYLRGRGQGFNSYAAGNKTYGGGRSAPNVGKVSNTLGYKIRDAKSKIPDQSSNAFRNDRSSNMRSALLRKLKDTQKGRITPQKPVPGVYSGRSGGM